MQIDLEVKIDGLETLKQGATLKHNYNEPTNRSLHIKAQLEEVLIDGFWLLMKNRQN